MLNTDESSGPWHPLTRIVFRFFAAYFALYVVLTQMLFGLLFVPTPEWLSTRLFKGYQRFLTDPAQHAVIWIGNRVFHTSIQVVPTGSGDTMFNYAQVFCLAVLALVIALLWSILDRRRERYDRTYRWFRVFLRFALGTTMLSYGFSKAFPLQMPAPQLTRLLEPYGNFSPMGVLWYSIGASFPYERFVGIVEVIGGTLLFFPRTQLAGALVCVGAAFEIFMLNMTYDVPVKLFSFHLIVISLVLIAPYATRLGSVVFNVRARSAWAAVVQVIIGVWLLYSGYKGGAESFASGPMAPKPPLYGIWTIEKMTIDGVERAPLVTDYDRWRRVVIQNKTDIRFWRMDDTFLQLTAKLDPAAKTIALTRGKDAAGQLSFEQPAPDHTVFDGTIDGHKLHLQTQLFDHTKMLLLTRGFNWVQEFPFNR